MKKIIRIARTAAAFIFLVIGAAGLVIPVFPTVPFIVIAALILGRKPSDVIHFFGEITKKAQDKLKKILRRLSRKRLSKHGENQK